LQAIISFGRRRRRRPRSSVSRDQTGRTAALQVICDDTDSNTVGIARGYANRITIDYMHQVLTQRIKRSQGRHDPTVLVDSRPRARSNEKLESRNYLVPGVIVIVVSLVSLLLKSMAVVLDTEIGTIEQTMVTPITPAEVILGKTLLFVRIAFVDATAILLTGVFWFKVPLRGSLVLLYSATFLVVVRYIFLKGVGLTCLGPHLLGLAAMGFATLALAVRRFHKSP
jgi:ABC-2 type transport system permease protein